MNSYSQDSTSSYSTINWSLFYKDAFTALTYGLPLYFYPNITDYNGLGDAFRRFQFSGNDFFQASKSINRDFSAKLITSPYVNYNGPRIDSLIEVDFSFNDSEKHPSYAYYLERDSSNDVAFFIIPGSNPNQSYLIYYKSNPVYDPINNYHGDIAKLGASLGDTYVYIKPNEDALALHDSTTWYKINDSYLYNKLLTQNTPYGANYLIECIAYVKYLKTKYKKVIVIGLSQGGLASLLVSLATHPTASVVSTGYSILFDNAYSAGIDQLNIPGLFSTFNKDSILKNIKNNETQYFFSWGRQESYAGYQNENMNHTTETYFQDSSHTRYFYNFVGHVFPRPQVDSFLYEMVSRPKVKLHINRMNCITDTVSMALTFMGDTPPYNFRLYRNDTIVNTYSLNTTTQFINLTQDGKYKIGNITSGSGLLGLPSEIVDVNVNSFTPQFDPPILDTTRNKVYITYNLGADYDSVLLKYRSGTDTNIILNKLLAEREGILSFNPGYYFLDSLIYNENCAYALNYNVNIPKADVEDLSRYDACAQTHKLRITFQGSPPFQFRLMKDSLLMAESYSLTGSDTILNLPDTGMYQVTNVIGTNNSVGFDSDTISLGFQKLPQPVISIIQNNIVLTTDTARQLIKWYFNGEYINGSDGQISITASGAGNYKCLLTSILGCTLASNTLEYRGEGYLQILPNPGRNNVNIVIDDVRNKSYDLLVYKVNGQRLFNTIVQGNTYNLDVSRWGNGLYVIKVIGRDDKAFIYTIKFTKI